MEEWNFTDVFLTVEYVEQEQRAAKIKLGKGLLGQLLYTFWYENYNEFLDLLEIDLSANLSADTASRLITLHRVVYGNRTEIANALASSFYLIVARADRQYKHFNETYSFNISVLFISRCIQFGESVASEQYVQSIN